MKLLEVGREGILSLLLKMKYPENTKLIHTLYGPCIIPMLLTIYDSRK